MESLEEIIFCCIYENLPLEQALDFFREYYPQEENKFFYGFTQKSIIDPKTHPWIFLLIKHGKPRTRRAILKVRRRALRCSKHTSSRKKAVKFNLEKILQDNL